MSWIKYEKDDLSFKVPEKLGFDVFKLIEPEETDNKIKELIKGRIPAQRWGRAQDLMGAMVFLASAASDYVNGQLLVIDGGYSIR